MHLKNVSKLTTLKCFLLLKLLSGRKSPKFPDLFQYYIMVSVQMFFQTCKLIFFFLQLQQITSYLPWICKKGHFTFFTTKLCIWGSNCIPIHSLSHSCTCCIALTTSCCSVSFLKSIQYPDENHSWERLFSNRQCSCITLQIHICS